MSIWERCQGEQHITSISGTLYRLVESQEHIATLDYVDSLEEQALLEDMLENTKPNYPDNSTSYHYLLKTPFRYPHYLGGHALDAPMNQACFMVAPPLIPYWLNPHTIALFFGTPWKRQPAPPKYAPSTRYFRPTTEQHEAYNYNITPLVITPTN